MAMHGARGKRVEGGSRKSIESRVAGMEASEVNAIASEAVSDLSRRMSTGRQFEPTKTDCHLMSLVPQLLKVNQTTLDDLQRGKQGGKEVHVTTSATVSKRAANFLNAERKRVAYSQCGSAVVGESPVDSIGNFVARTSNSGQKPWYSRTTTYSSPERRTSSPGRGKAIGARYKPRGLKAVRAWPC